MKKQKIKIPLKTGYEFDYLTRWRRYLKPKSGVIKYVKNNYNKRLRRMFKKELR